MKRGRGSTLTGGTGDVNPQVYSLTVSQTATDLSVVQQFPVPVFRFPIKSNRAMVMELLRTQWIIGDIAVPAAQLSIAAGISTSNPAHLVNGTASTQADQFNALASPTIVDSFSLDGIFLSAVGVVYQSRIQDHDKTDSAGHGILIATDNLYMFYSSLNGVAANVMNCKLTYRWKEVELAEYIGIVQSQQNPT